jgi:hypothetical protein
MAINSYLSANRNNGAQWRSEHNESYVKENSGIENGYQ